MNALFKLDIIKNLFNFKSTLKNASLIAKYNVDIRASLKKVPGCILI